MIMILDSTTSPDISFEKYRISPLTVWLWIYSAIFSFPLNLSINNLWNKLTLQARDLCPECRYVWIRSCIIFVSSFTKNLDFFSSANGFSGQANILLMEKNDLNGAEDGDDVGLGTKSQSHNFPGWKMNNVTAGSILAPFPSPGPARPVEKLGTNKRKNKLLVVKRQRKVLGRKETSLFKKMAKSDVAFFQVCKSGVGSLHSRLDLRNAIQCNALPSPSKMHTFVRSLAPESQSDENASHHIT